MEPLPRKPLRDLPVLSWTDADSVGVVKRSLREHERGVFGPASQLVDLMGRDDRISSKLAERIGTLLATPLEMEPSGHAQRSGRPVRALEDAWPRMFPDEQLTELCHWGLMLGVGLGELVWERGSTTWTPRLHKVWHPRYLYWRWDTRTYWVQTLDGLVEVTPGDRRWVLFTPHGYERGWMRGLVRCLAIPWLIRQWAFRDWARYSEVHGLPIRKGIVPASAKEEAKKAFLVGLANLGNETVVEVPQGQDGNKFDVELLEAAANTWEGFEGLLGKAEDAIAIAILGQNLTTEVKQGSKAAASVHQGVKEDVVKADAKRLPACLREQVLRPWATVNFGDEELAPCPRYRTDPPEDENSRATGLLALGQALQSLQAAGGRPDVDAMLEEYGVPTTGAAEEPEEPAEEPPPKPGEAPEDGEEEPDGDEEPPEAKQVAASRIAARSRLRGTVKGQLFADALADSAKGHARRAVKPSLDQVLAVVQAATSYEDLRARLLRTFRALEPDGLAELMEKSLVLAQLAGRHAVLEDL